MIESISIRSAVFWSILAPSLHIVCSSQAHTAKSLNEVKTYRASHFDWVFLLYTICIYITMYVCICIYIYVCNMMHVYIYTHIICIYVLYVYTYYNHKCRPEKKTIINSHWASSHTITVFFPSKSTETTTATLSGPDDRRLCRSRFDDRRSSHHLDSRASWLPVTAWSSPCCTSGFAASLVRKSRKTWKTIESLGVFFQNGSRQKRFETTKQ
jgi:Ca2+/Na+ antiporter